MYPYLYTQFFRKIIMSMTENELLNVLKQAARAGYLGGGSGGATTGGGTLGGGSSGAGQFSKELGAAGDAVKGLGSAFLSTSSKIAEGNARLGDVTQALSAGFSGLGQSGSLLGASLATGAKALDALGQNIDQNIDTWRKLSDTGLSFGNDIMEMKNQASGARLSIAEFGEVVQKNNSIMFGFGATSAESAKQLSKMSNEFFTSGLGEQLRGMGYTTKELNDVMAVSISGSKIKDLNDKDSRDKALKAAASLATEMDAVSKITGQSRESMLDELRKKGASGQRQAAIDQAIAEGGEGAKAAFDAITVNSGLAGEQFQKIAEDMAATGRPSAENAKAFALLGPKSQEALVEMEAAAKRGDAVESARLAKKAAMETVEFQKTEEFRTLTRDSKMKELTDAYSQGAKLREATEMMKKEGGTIEENMAKLNAKIKAEQDAGGKNDPNAAAGASITRFAVDLESRGRDLTKVLNDQVIQPLSKDVADKIVKLSNKLNLGSSTVVQDQLGKPMAAGYDKARLDRIVKEEAGDKSSPNKGVGDKDAASKDVQEFHKLITGNQKQSDTALKVIEKIANEKSMSKEDVVKGAMANKGAGMADLVKQIKTALPADAQLDKTEADKTKKDKITHVTGDKATPAGELLGAGVEKLGAMFRDGSAKVTVIKGDATPSGERRAGGSLDMAGKMFEDWGKGTMVELHGLEGVMRPQDISKVIESAMSGVRKTMPKIDMAGGAGTKLEMPKLEMPKLEMPTGGKDKEFAALAAEMGKMGRPDMSKLDLSSISKSISTSISSVTGGGSTTTKQVQTDDSKAAQQELLALEKAQVAERLKAVAQLKEEGVIKGKFASSSDYKNIPQLAALKEKQDGEKAVLSKRVDAGTSMETVREEAKAETTKMISEQIAITKTSNSTLKDTYSQGAKLREAIALKDTESLSDMYKDDSKTKLAMAKLSNAALFQEAELAKSVVGTSVKDMSEDMINAMIPKGATIEDYYVDMNGKLQSNAADTVAKMEKTAKDSANVVETYSTTISSHITDALPVKEMASKQEEFHSQFTNSQQKIIDDYKGYSEENRSFRAQAMQSGIKEDTETAQMISARISKMKADIGDRQATKEEEAALENETLNKQMFEKQVESKKEMLDVMQNLGEYGAKRELELKQKAANEAKTIAIEDKKTDAITAELPVNGVAMGPQPEVNDKDVKEQYQKRRDEYNAMAKNGTGPFGGGKEKAADEAKSELARESRRSTPQEAPKSKAMSISDMMGGGMTMGANGMPIMKKIDTAKNSIPAKPADADADRENAKFKRQAEEKKVEAEKMAAKKPDAKAATTESTLSDVVAQLNSLNKQMGQLIAVSEDGHKATTKAAKSGASNIYAR
jgi:hypothetical protein